MGLFRKIIEFSENCENQMFKMCKVRTDEFRNCPRPLCCGWCPEKCDNICSKIREEVGDV